MSEQEQIAAWLETVRGVPIGVSGLIRDGRYKRDSGSDPQGQDRADGLGAQASQNGGDKPHRPLTPSKLT